MKNLKNSFLLGLVILLTACGGSGGGSAVSGVTVTPPMPTPAPPQIELTGIAAVGAALDGAVIEIIDAAGNLVDIGDSATGSDGSYSVVLPADTLLPVVIRATPPGGSPLLSIVQAPTDGGTDVVANINPVTNLVSNSVLGTNNSSSDGDIAGALATVDPTSINASGDAIIDKVFGANVNYDAFATDPDFVANDGTGPGSAADAVLDTVARRAKAAGTSVEEALKLFNEAAEPPTLLEDPTFQVELVSELVKAGTDVADLEAGLTDIGAINDPPSDGGTDVFRTIIEVVPAVIATTRGNTQSVQGNQDLVNAAIDATVTVITNTIETKMDRFNASTDDLNTLLTSPSFQSTATKVVATAITPILEAANESGDVETLLDAVTDLTTSIAKEASNIVSGVSFDATSADVSDLVTGLVTNTVTSTPITTQSLQQISAGTLTPQNIVTGTGDVSKAGELLTDFANQNPDLVDGDIADAIQTIPTGSWGQSDWDNFNWG
ncbi:MAG: hypothetical protein ACE37D_06725 [Pseudomonadales bacterium]